MNISVRQIFLYLFLAAIAILYALVNAG